MAEQIGPPSGENQCGGAFIMPAQGAALARLLQLTSSPRLPTSLHDGRCRGGACSS